MRRRLPLLLALACLVTPSCFISRTRTNSALDAEAYARLVPGQSTQDDVLAELGAPVDVVQLGRRSAWRYDHTQAKDAALFLILVTFRNIDSDQDRVWAFFDEEGVLTHVGGTFESDEAGYKMPWQD